MRISWANDGVVETGLDRGVLYLADGTGVPWNGLVGATEKGDDVVQADLYYDGVRFAFAQGGEDFLLDLEAWSYPTQFENLEGIAAEQPPKLFNMTYRVGRGKGYLIHLVWNALATVSDKANTTKNASAEMSIFSWEVVTKPKKVEGIRPTAHFVIDSNIAPEDALSDLEDLLYGSDTGDARMPEPYEVIDLFLEHAVLVITDNGDGTWTAEGPDEAIQMLDGNTFQITWPSAVYIDATEYTISSL